MGGMHAQVYAKLRQARVVAIVDSHRKSAAANAKKIGSTFLSLKTWTRRSPGIPRMSSTSACQRPLHAAYVRRALKAGKNIFCEKPFTSDAREALALAEAAERSGTKMQIGQCVRFWPEYQAFEAFFRSRRAGRLLSFSLQRRAGRPTYSIGDWLNRGKLSGGAALDLHIHDTDFVHHLLGRPKAVTSTGTKDTSGWSHIFTTYHFDGIAVTAEGGWNYPRQWGFQMAFQAVFERGTVVEFDSAAIPTLVSTVGSGTKKPLPYRQPRAGNPRAGWATSRRSAAITTSCPRSSIAWSTAASRSWRRPGRRPIPSGPCWRKSSPRRRGARSSSEPTRLHEKINQHMVVSVRMAPRTETETGEEGGV